MRPARHTVGSASGGCASADFPSRSHGLRSRSRTFQTGDCPMLKFLGLIGLLAILVAIAAAVFFFGGFYSVAANIEDPSIVQAALIQVRQASIARHAKDKPPVPLEDADTVRAGARAFSTRGCVNCHGGPGVDWGKWSEG